MGRAKSLHEPDLAGGPNPVPGVGTVGPHPAKWRGQGATWSWSSHMRERDFGLIPTQPWRERGHRLAPSLAWQREGRLMQPHSREGKRVAWPQPSYREGRGHCVAPVRSCQGRVLAQLQSTAWDLPFWQQREPAILIVTGLLVLNISTFGELFGWDSKALWATFRPLVRGWAPQI